MHYFCSKKMKARLILSSLLLSSSLTCHADDFSGSPRLNLGLQYDAELHTNFGRGYNFLNLLRLNGSARIGRHLQVNVSTLSMAKAGESLTGDALTASSIEAGLNIPLTLAVAGMGWEHTSKRGVHSVFTGIRNTGEDYFTSETAAFFTNSSCGLFPTISTNFPLCTYPFAAMGLHYEYGGQEWGAKVSLYNGGEHYRFTGRENLFRVCPQSDGLMLMMQGEYKGAGCNAFLGGSLYDASPTLWTYAEWRAGLLKTGNLNLIAAYSHCFGRDRECRHFAGAGAKYSTGRAELGLFGSYSDLLTGHEFTAELSCNVTLSPRISLKPSIHYISSVTQKVILGLARMTLIL